MIEVTLETIQVSLVSSHRIVVLKEIASDRYLPIWIGPCEAEAISVGVKGVQMLRPLTHDLIVSVIDALDAELQYVFVNELVDNNFRARLVLAAPDGERSVDARPSDAVATAVRLGTPIFVDEAVMEQASVSPEPDVLDEATLDAKDLGVFRDFLSSLDVGDPKDN